MLFEKIRRTQKPVFIMLGLVFALSFTLLGVGSGVGGFSLADLVGQSNSSSGTSVSSWTDKVHQDPKNPANWLGLANAYQVAGQTAPALGALQQYLNLKP